MLLTTEQAARLLVDHMSNNAAQVNYLALQTEFERFPHLVKIELGDASSAVLAVGEGEAELFELLSGEGKLRRTLMLRQRHARVTDSRYLVASNRPQIGGFDYVDLVHETLPDGRLRVNARALGEEDVAAVRAVLASLLD